MYQFFTEPSNINDKSVIIEGSDVNHIKNVLRIKPGEEISVSNGIDGREYRCEVVSLSDDRVECRIRFIKEDNVELPNKVYLFQGYPKGDKMELIVQKCIELGVYEIVPVFMKRTIVKLDEKKTESRVKRLNGIAEAAAKQSKRAIIPRVNRIMSFKEAIDYAKDLDILLVPYELAEDMEHTRQILTGIEKGKSLAVFIGPEGGIDESEIEALKSIGANIITLGRRILRTETAGLTVLSWLTYILEE